MSVTGSVSDRGISENFYPTSCQVSLHLCTIDSISRVELVMRKSVVRLPAAPYAQSGTFELSWHKLLFDHLKVQVYRQRILSHYRIATSVIKLAELPGYTGTYIAEYPLMNVNNKTEALGNIHLKFEFKYDMNTCESPVESEDLEAIFQREAGRPSMSIQRSVTYSGSPARSNSYASSTSGYSQRSLSSSRGSSFSGLSLLSEKTRNGFKELSELVAAFTSTGWNKISKTEFARGLLLLQEFYRLNPIPRTNKVVDDLGQLKIAAYFMDFALPTYGTIALNYFGYGKGVLDFVKFSDKKVALEHLKLDPKDILVWQYGSPELYKANFFACHDRKTNSIVIAIRGTFNLHESLLDTHLEYAPFLNGHAHKGMMETALLLEEQYLESIKEWVRERKVKALYLVGHSLGAAVVSIFLLRVRDLLLQEFGPDFRIEGFNFATPPCVSANLIPGTEQYIQNYINENDIVPHMSFGAIMDLKELIVKAAALSQDRKLTKADRMELIQKYKQQLKQENKHPRLYSPGRQFFMYKTSRVYHHTSKGSIKQGLLHDNTGNPLIDNHGPHYVIEETAQEHFEDADVRPNMIWHHLLNKYDVSLRKAHDWLADYLKKNPNYESPATSTTASVADPQEMPPFQDTLGAYEMTALVQSLDKLR